MIAPWGRSIVLVSALFAVLAAATLSLVLDGAWRFLALAPLALGALVFWFFRDPERTPPNDASALLAPSDGRVVEIAHTENDEFLRGPAVRIGVFLSLLDVHVIRAPCAATVLATRYQPGQFFNARGPLAATENEWRWIGFEDDQGRPLAVRLIAGALARRIVCAVETGDRVAAGERIGMIRFGSRTELVVPQSGTEVLVKAGDRVRAGETVIARAGATARNGTAGGAREGLGRGAGMP